MLQYRLYGGKSLPTDLEGFVKAGATIGNVIGQFAFGTYWFYPDDTSVILTVS
jgi:PHS family inorganic phosphate transporter-like MFS transporter